MKMLQYIERQVSALNDLIRINNDRITGYEKRMSAILDDDLDDLFSQFIFQSRQNNDELIQCIHRLGGTPPDGSHLSGKFYHAWMDIKSFVSRQTRQMLLDYCEYCEDVARSAYQQALGDYEIQWDNNEVNLLKKHINGLTMSYNQVKELQ